MGLEIETELSIGVDVELGMRGRRCDLRNRVAFVEAVSFMGLALWLLCLSFFRGDKTDFSGCDLGVIFER